MNLVRSITLLTLANNFTISATTSLGWKMLSLTPFPVFRWTVSGAWLPQPLSISASSLYLRCSSDCLGTAILPCLFCPLHQANLPGRSETFFNLEPYAWIGELLQPSTASNRTDSDLFCLLLSQNSAMPYDTIDCRPIPSSWTQFPPPH